MIRLGPRETAEIEIGQDYHTVKETKGRAVALGANDLSRVKTGCVDSKVVKRFFADSITYQAALTPCSFTARSYTRMHSRRASRCVKRNRELPAISRDVCVEE
ncbi:hypothetical protein ALC53_09556 [Atta colombica]|uniref:Uncharacterized protein n=1 Tax=Atta colombica TaxID=520822 RepID=A0A195B6Z4_9HYME|nr:hypothetical protein ALC53_09556 [Atta colombica]